jgi:uncharacterized short protein YbdD (DUF466 family)
LTKPSENLLTQWFGRVQETARMMVGVPDYDAYLAHMRVKHPDKPTLSYEGFFENRLDARYGRSTTRCCC